MSVQTKDGKWHPYPPGVNFEDIQEVRNNKREKVDFFTKDGELPELYPTLFERNFNGLPAGDICDKPPVLFSKEELRDFSWEKMRRDSSPGTDDYSDWLQINEEENKNY